MKRPSEAAFGEALRGVDLSMVVYKPPDDARNWKPCDYMVWMDPSIPRWPAAWFEVKDVDTLRGFAFGELRAAQLLGIREAESVGLPYWLAVYWRRHRSWTISDAARVLAWRGNQALEHGGATSIRRELLMSRFGVDATPGNLGSVLKNVLLGEAD